MSIKRYDMKRHEESGFWEHPETVDGVFVKYDDHAKAIEELEAQVKQLAAENAKLADCANFYRLGFKPVKGAFGIEYRPTEQLLDDCGNTALEAIKTPATDSVLASLRADAIDFAAYHLPSNGKYEDMILTLADEVREGLIEVKIPAPKYQRSQSEQVKGVQS